MLKLESLELSGFKSFVDPVTVSFAGGITAIVGPNGCGKSNLSDGMSWVLGEQSAKSLRGGKMEDIIFNGSESRRPAGLAEAHLTLRTDPDFPYSEEGTITIGRRVFRTGESQYRLNGKTVRLKEIKDLLMDTGLGIRAYSVIEQGKIGMILSSKPQERRKLLEEAAGITRYKARKRVAELKLEEALANLVRLDDVISEVERALRSLKRQASAARRYQQKQIEYLELLRRVLLARGRQMLDQHREVAGQLEEGVASDAELSAGLSRDEAALAAGREALERQSEVLGQCHQRRSDLAATIEGRQEFLRTSRQTLQELDERLTSGRALAERRREEGEVAGRRLLEVEQRHEEIESERENAAAAVEADEDQIVSAERLLRDSEQRASALKAEVMAAAAAAQGVDRKRQQADLEQERLRLEEKHLEDELDSSAAEVEQTGEAVAIARDQLRDLERRRDEGSTALETVDAALEETLEQESRASEERSATRDALTAALQRQEVLEQLARTDEERRESLAVALDAAGVAAPRYLAQLLDRRAAGGDPDAPGDGWEGPLDFYLGRLTDAVVVESTESAVGLARFLSGQVSGGAALLQTPDPEDLPATTAETAARDSALAADPGAVLPLPRALGLPETISPALPPAWLTATAEDAERLARSWPGVAFISRDGLWAQGGLLHVEGEQTVPGLLARDRELEELGEQIPALREKLEAVKATIETLVTTRSQQAKEKNRLGGELSQIRQDLAVSEARLQDLQGRLERLESQRRQVEQRRLELDQRRQSLEQRRGELETEIRRAQERQSGLGEALDRADTEIGSARQHREGLRSESAGRRSRLEVLDERLEGVRAESRRLKQEVDEAQRQSTQWQQEGERLARRRRELEVSREEAEVTLQQALNDREAADDQVILEQEKLDDLRVDIKTLEERITGFRDRRDDVRATLEQLRVRQASLEGDLEHLAHTFHENFPPAPPRSSRRRDDGEQHVEGHGEQDGEQEEGAAADAAGRDSERGASDQPTEPPQLAGQRDEAAAGGLNTDGMDDEAATEFFAADPLAPTPRQLLEEALEEQAAIAAQAAESGETPSVGGPLPAMEADLARLKAALDRLGPVNLLAMEEFEEQRERHEFLVEQRADVADSVTSLRQTIREINETSSERFRETFVQVNATFGHIFSRLFRGGEAEMRLLDDDDVLETGIEIVARPPGKRLQNIQLMSGGEKALTAIALLFALFRTKPSPFCILDEVDAPLDDANCLRFVETLQEMSQDTQFLVVSHNKITMEAAGTLYGVTMEERGVSKLVSVEMEQLHPEGQRASA